MASQKAKTRKHRAPASSAEARFAELEQLLIAKHQALKALLTRLAEPELDPAETSRAHREARGLRREIKKLEKAYLLLGKDRELQRFTELRPEFGLTEDQLILRRAAGLVNATGKHKGKSIWMIIATNTFTFFNLLYAVMTVLIVSVSSFENLTFLPIIVANTLIGIIQEIRAKLTIDKLSLLSAGQATVVRAGEVLVIDPHAVVLDDIVHLKSGEQIFTDCILIEGFIEANEALLTGEADAVEKKPGDALLSGSFVASGECYARVDKIGADNYVERLAAEAKKYQKPRSELLASLRKIIVWIAIFIVPLGMAIFSISIKHDWARLFASGGFDLYKQGVLPATAVVIGMIPSGLFLLATIALSVSVIRLGKKNTLVQELYCIEMLARVDTLCLDKTGTITDGSMRVVDSLQLDPQFDYTLREVVGSMMHAFPDKNATAKALVAFYGENRVLTATEKIPFSSKRKFSAVTFVRGKQQKPVGTFFLGAPEFVLGKGYKTVQKRVERFAETGCRVLAVGFSANKSALTRHPAQVKALGLIVLEDHIRETAFETMQYFKKQGVDIKVISGDSAVTVAQIAQKAGIDNAKRYISLEGKSDAEARALATEYTVFGRVSPSQKRALVAGLHDKGRTVAMTGDGVNDILALKEADCSIAMASGSDAARYASHLVLLDSDFSSMPQVVEEGRRVVNNIERSGALFIAKTVFVIALTLLYLLLGTLNPSLQDFRYPFETSQMFIIEFLAIGVATIFLALQPSKGIIRGKFINNVLKNALPTAFAVVFLHLLLYLLIPVYFDQSNNVQVYSTVALLVTTFILLDLSVQVGTPFVWWKWIMYGVTVGSSIILFALAFAYRDGFINGFLKVTALDKTTILLTILLMLVGHLVVDLFARIFSKSLKKPLSENAFDKYLK